MSFNKFMHPRNKYQSPPDFKELAIQYPEFRKHLTQDLSGKLKFNFQNPEALRIFTTTLLHKDFGLNVNIPSSRLVPTLPLRLNYILWIEDLLAANQIQSPIHGIDVGTGASCIYPLLGCQKNSWRMLALENDSYNSECAQMNVKQNGMQEFIKVEHTGSKSLQLNSWLKPNISYSFTMCNPPFFASSEDVTWEHGENTNTQDTVPCQGSSQERPNLSPAKSRRARGRNRGGRPPPSNGHTGELCELMAEGGEVSFVKRMVENIHLEQIRIFTTMLGHKSSFIELKNFLMQHSRVKQVSHTEFCQGNTMRWGLAWTAHADIKLPNELPRRRAGSSKAKPVMTLVEGREVRDVARRVLALCDALKIIYKILHEHPDGTCTKLVITACENTWSHQRRNRRLKRRQDSVAFDQNTTGSYSAAQCQNTVVSDSTACKRNQETGVFETAACSQNTSGVAFAAPCQNTAVSDSTACKRNQDTVGFDLAACKRNQETGRFDPAACKRTKCEKTDNDNCIEERTKNSSRFAENDSETDRVNCENTKTRLEQLKSALRVNENCSQWLKNDSSGSENCLKRSDHDCDVESMEEDLEGRRNEINELRKTEELVKGPNDSVLNDETVSQKSKSVSNGDCVTVSNDISRHTSSDSVTYKEATLSRKRPFLDAHVDEITQNGSNIKVNWGIIDTRPDSRVTKMIDKIEDSHISDPTRAIEKSPLVVCNVLIEKLDPSSDDNRVAIEMIWVSGTGSKDLPHQILQYFKNNL